jgi:hypothetical protein
MAVENKMALVVSARGTIIDSIDTGKEKVS